MAGFFGRFTPSPECKGFFSRDCGIRMTDSEEPALSEANGAQDKGLLTTPNQTAPANFSRG